MSSGGQSWEENMFDLVVKFLLPLAAVGAAVYFLIKLIAAALFWVWWSVPFAIFYALPVAVLAPGLGFVWAFFCQVSPPDTELSPSEKERHHASGKESSSWKRVYSYPLQLNYACVVIALPITVVLAYLFVGVPTDHPVIHETIGKGKHAEEIARYVLQWPWAYELFNRFNSWWQSVFTVLLEGKPYREMLFDRNDVSGSVWFSVLVGAPAVFWFISAKKLSEQEITREQQAESVVMSERRKWERKETEWREQEAKYEEALKKWSEVFERQKTQLETYKAREEHLVKPALRVELEKQKPGVLDSDVL